MRKALLALVSLSNIATAAATKHRNVTFWYTPDGYGDFKDVLANLEKHKDTVSTVILECGHSVNSDVPGQLTCSDSYDKLDKKCKYAAECCIATVKGLKALDINVELLVGGGGGNGNWKNFAPANATIATKTMIEIAKRFNATGVNLDYEPDPSKPTDQQPFADYLKFIKPMLNAEGMRLTVDVASWCTMTNNFELLAPHVDRLLDMETYNADSMEGWLKGDGYGGYYNSLVNDKVPRDKAGPGLGIWARDCQKGKPCWSTTEASGKPRIDRMIADGVQELAMFRLMWIAPHGKPVHNPQEWWWPLLKEFADAPLSKKGEDVSHATGLQTILV